MKYFEFFNPVKICAGEDAILHLSYELEALSIHNPLILTDEGLLKLGIVNKVIKKSGIEKYEIFSNIPVDSGVAVVNSVLEYLTVKMCDGIVAIGGGSVIDTAKGVKMAYLRTSDLKAIMGLEVIKRAQELPFIVLPTTAGTGSECTNVAVIRDESNDVKMEFISPYLMPNVAIIDPMLTATLPSKITASTGFDALVHAIEGYSCLQRNPISSVYAKTAIKLIFENIEIACKEPDNMLARFNMALASTMAGLCFGNSMVGAVHAIGHALGGVCQIAHGDAMTILLPYVMEYNKEKMAETYADLADVILPLNQITDSAIDKCDKVIVAIKDLRKRLNILTGLPISLTDTKKYDRLQIETIASGAVNDGAMLLNPVAMDENDVKEILMSAE